MCRHGDKSVSCRPRCAQQIRSWENDSIFWFPGCCLPASPIPVTQSQAARKAKLISWDWFPQAKYTFSTQPLHSNVVQKMQKLYITEIATACMNGFYDSTSKYYKLQTLLCIQKAVITKSVLPFDDKMYGLNKLLYGFEKWVSSSLHEPPTGAIDRVSPGASSSEQATINHWLRTFTSHFI